MMMRTPEKTPMPTRVAMVSGTKYPSGEGLAFYHLACYLQANGFDVHYYAHNTAHPLATQALRVENETLKPVTVHPLTSFKLNPAEDEGGHQPFTHVIHRDMADYLVASHSIAYLHQTLAREATRAKKKYRRWQKRLHGIQAQLETCFRNVWHTFMPATHCHQTLYTCHGLIKHDSKTKAYLQSADTVCKLVHAPETFPLFYADTLHRSPEKPEHVAGIVHSICPENQTLETIQYALAQGMKRVVLYGALKDTIYYYTQIQPFIEAHQASQALLPPESRTAIHVAGFVGYPEARQAMYDVLSHVVSLHPPDKTFLLQTECHATGTLFMSPHEPFRGITFPPCNGVQEALTMPETNHLAWHQRLGLLS
jgi:hypothetical protein